MIRGLRTAFYDTTKNMKYEFMVILQINLCRVFERNILVLYKYQILHTIYHSGTPIKFMNEIIHSIIA